MSSSKVAERYAKSIIEIAEEQNALPDVESDFLMVGRAIEGSRDLQNFLATPIIDDHRKEHILAEIFAGHVTPLVERFIALLARKGRASHLPQVVVAFATLLDRMRHVTPAAITSAVELDAAQRARVEAQLAAMSGGTIRPEYRVDPSLIGGFRALFANRMVDASVRHQLDRLRETLVEGRN
jgi:F-type H+-transporting ATPase subunit delta